MDFGLDPPFIQVEEEEINDVREFLPPSFFSDSANNGNRYFPFVEPPPEHPSPSSGPKSPPHPPSGVKPLPPMVPRSQNSHREPFTPNPLIPSTSLSRSPSSDTTSTHTESAATDDEPILSPIPFARGLDRPRLHRSIPDTTKDPLIPKGGFRRIPGAVSPEGPSTATPKPAMVCSPGTLRRINALSSDEFRIATRGLSDTRATSARGDLTFVRSGQQTHSSVGEQKRSDKLGDTSSRKREGTD